MSQLMFMRFLAGFILVLTKDFRWVQQFQDLITASKDLVSGKAPIGICHSKKLMVKYKNKVIEKQDPYVNKTDESTFSNKSQHVDFATLRN